MSAREKAAIITVQISVGAVYVTSVQTKELMVPLAGNNFGVIPPNDTVWVASIF